VSHNRRVATIAAAIRVYGDPIMRATVGPLPSAVYWRRRAVVLGAVLLGIIVLFVSCSGDDKNDQRGQGTSASQKPTPAPNNSSPDIEPSFLDSAPPGNGPTLPAPGDLESPGDDNAVPSGLPTLGGGTGQNTNVQGPAGGTCADSEMSVTPIPGAATVKRGANVDLSLTIKNIGRRACARDLGADSQELYIVQGARRYWSSDTCSTSKGNELRQLNPGEERTFKVTWNGRQSNECAGGIATGPNPPPGQFQLFARLGTLISNPVALTIVS
jgi:archaellum component FlaG (FlaF/FlaG flagellin family)